MGSRGMQRQIRVNRPAARRAIKAYLDPIKAERRCQQAALEAELSKEPQFAGLLGLLPMESIVSDIIGSQRPTGTIGGLSRTRPVPFITESVILRDMSMDEARRRWFLEWR